MTDWMSGKIDCDQQCDIPAGRVMTRVPPSRHVWSDIMRCSTCGDTFLIRPMADVQSAADGEKEDK